MLSFFHFAEIQITDKKKWEIRIAEVKESIPIKSPQLKYT